MELTEEGVLGHYVATFDERTRTAHQVALAGAIATREDKWPTVEIVRRVARLYGVAIEELGAYFGLMRQPGKRDIWIDVYRSPDCHSLALEEMTESQSRAYGMMLTMRAVA